MRCQHCGFPDNTQGSTKCAECGAALEAADNDTPQQTIREDSPAPESHRPRLSTMQVEPTGLPAWDEKNAAQGGIKPASSSHPTICPHCQYVLVLESATCPNCKKNIGSAPMAQAPSTPERERQQTPAAPNMPYPAAKPAPKDEFTSAQSTPPSNMPKHRPATIDPYRMAKNAQASFVPVKKDREMQAPRPCLIETAPDEPFTLNRDVLDPENNTITGKTQAELVCHEGQWYIIDRSEMGNTFVRAARMTPLNKGDVVLMGDRKFTFEC